MTGLALPRARARRKRRRPPGPGFWRALRWVVVDIVAAVFDFAVAGGVIGYSCGGIMILALWLMDWPRLHREIDAWRDDDE